MDAKTDTTGCRRNAAAFLYIVQWSETVYNIRQKRSETIGGLRYGRTV